MDEVCIKWVWTGSCVNREFGLVGKKCGGEFFIFDVFYFNERFGFGKRFRFVSMECVGGVLVSYFGDYFSERFDTW